MGMGKWGLLSGLGQGMSQAGTAFFNDGMEQLKEQRLEQIRDRQYAREREDTLTDQQTRMEFEARESQLDRDSVASRTASAYQDDIIGLQNYRKELMADPAGNAQAITEVDARISRLNSVGSTTPSKYQTDEYWSSLVSGRAEELVDRGDFGSYEEALLVARRQIAAERESFGGGGGGLLGGESGGSSDGTDPMVIQTIYSQIDAMPDGPAKDMRMSKFAMDFPSFTPQQ